MQSPSIRIEKEMVTDAVNKMKNGKARGPTGVVVEILKAIGDACIDIVTDLVNAIIHDGRVPSDCQVRSIVNSFKWKREAKEPGNYLGLKLLEQVMSVIERIEW